MKKIICFSLASANEFSKHFIEKSSRDNPIQLFLHKANLMLDAYYLYIAIPEIPHLKIHKIQYPIHCSSKEEMEEMFANFDANDFFDELSDWVVSQKNISKSNENNTSSNGNDTNSEQTLGSSRKNNLGV